MGKPEKNQMIIETVPHDVEGEDLAGNQPVRASGEGESEWIDFESDFIFPSDDHAEARSGPSVKKSREEVLAETVALAEKLSGRKNTGFFQRTEEGFGAEIEDFSDDGFLDETVSVAKAEKENLFSEKNSEAMAGGCFFATIGLSLLCLFISFLMLGMAHFPGVPGFCFFETVAVVLLVASREFLKGWGYPQRAFRVGLTAGFFAWEILVILFWSVFVTALWQDHSLYLLSDKHASSILLALLAGMAFFPMAFCSLQMIEWARGRRFIVGKPGFVFISLAVSGAACSFAELLLFL